jgi:hypothetical protein
MFRGISSALAIFLVVAFVLAIHGEAYPQTAADTAQVASDTLTTPPDSLRSATGATSADQQSALRVFLDGGIAQDYVKEQIPFVNYVRDRKQAQVHLLTTSRGTGGLGTEYTILFTGLQEFAGINDTLTCITRDIDTTDQKRAEVVRVMKIGLLRYVSRTPQAKGIRVSYTGQAAPTELKDKWNYWVFGINGSAGLSGEESSENVSYAASISADRVTEDWKLAFGAATDYSETSYDIDGEEVLKTSRYSDFEAMVVKSLGNHFSAGLFGYASRSLYYNIDRSYEAGPALEYDVFPYSESTRRDFRFKYEIGYAFNRYNEETIYFKTEEDLYHQALSVSIDVQENWGTIYFSLAGSNYLHDFDLNRFTVGSSLYFRILEGWSVRLVGSYSAIHDQVTLPSRGATEEDILLRRRQLATQYNYSMSVGLSYRFGSKYANIVNPRFQ